jgi:hypothetical protein
MLAHSRAVLAQLLPKGIGRGLGQWRILFNRATRKAIITVGGHIVEALLHQFIDVALRIASPCDFRTLSQRVIALAVMV